MLLKVIFKSCIVIFCVRTLCFSYVSSFYDLSISRALIFMLLAIDFSFSRSRLSISIARLVLIAISPIPILFFLVSAHSILLFAFPLTTSLTISPNITHFVQTNNQSSSHPNPYPSPRCLVF
jgi:hypothetical protein